MSLVDSLLVSVFGMAVVFAVLIGLSLLLRVQSTLITRFTHPQSGALQVQEDDAVVAGMMPPTADVPIEQLDDLSQGSGLLRNLSGNSATVRNYSAQTHDRVIAAEAVYVPLSRGGAAAPLHVPSVKEKAAPAETSDMAANGAEVITAPVPGIIVEIKTAVGAKVKSGDILMLLEAMKMENEIVATRDGTVEKVMTSKGAAVNTGMPLIAIR